MTAWHMHLSPPAYPGGFLLAVLIRVVAGSGYATGHPQNPAPTVGKPSAAEPSPFTGPKSLIVRRSRLHLPPIDGLSNVGIAAQVLAFIKPILTTSRPPAAFSAVVVALSVPVPAFSAVPALPVLGLVAVLVLRATILMRRD